MLNTCLVAHEIVSVPGIAEPPIARIMGVNRRQCATFLAQDCCFRRPSNPGQVVRTMANLFVDWVGTAFFSLSVLRNEHRLDILVEPRKVDITENGANYAAHNVANFGTFFPAAALV